MPLPDPFNEALFSYLHNNETGFYDFLTSNRSRIIDIYGFVRPLDDESSPNYDVALTAVLSLDCTEDDVEELTEKFRSHANSIQSATDRLTMLQADGASGYHPEATNLNLVCLLRDFSLEDAVVMRRLTLDFLCWDEAHKSPID